MAQIFCINCGNKIPEGAHFCPACGTPRPSLPSDYQEQPAVQQPVQQPAQQPQPYAPQQDQYAAPDMPPPLGPEQPYQQPYQQPYAPGLPPQQYPPKKKSSGGIIALIAVLALAALTGGGWALYKYVLKPSAPIENNESSTSFSSEEDNTTYSTEAPIDSVANVTDTVVVDNNGTNEEVVNQDPQPDVPSIPKEKVNRRRPGEPWGMTDEEAAQMRRDRQNVPSIPRSQQRQSRRDRYNGEPWGMTDEEAAQMNDNYGMPMGMTDEEAAMMRKMQRQQRRARRR